MPKPQQITRHGQWRSTFAFIMATTGAAVGLGNIWKFPHMAGDNGGSAFVLIYIFFVAFIGLPVMMGEVFIGRLGRKNPVDSFKILAIEYQHTSWWQTLGWVGALALMLILSFYSVVAGWAVAYLVMALQGTFNHASPEQIHQIWDSLISNPYRLFLWHSVFMILTLLVVARGVEKGIETASKILMPFLFLVLIILVGYAFWQGNIMKALHFLFAFKLEAVNAKVVISALGHAFFTLALGAGALLVYGAYLPNQTNISKTLFIVAFLDTMVAICAGLAIFPIVFQYNLPPGEGYGLMYKILPITFGSLPGGQWVGALFFLLLVFAAWTSTFSMAEPLVMLAIEKFNLSRTTASCAVGIVAWILGIGGLLSFNIWHQPLLHNWTFFDILTLVPTNILLPIGGIGISLFSGWVLSKKATYLGLRFPIGGLYNLWRFIVRWIAPVAIMVIMIMGLL